MTMPLVVENMRETSLDRPKAKKEKLKSKSKRKKHSWTHDVVVDASYRDDSRKATGDLMKSSVSTMDQTHSMTTSEATKHDSFGSIQTSSLNPASTSRETERSMVNPDLLVTIEKDKRAMKKSLKKQAKKEKKLAKKARREASSVTEGPPSLASHSASQSHAQPSGTSTSNTGSRRTTSRGGDSVLSDITFDMEAHSVSTSRIQFHHEFPFETIAEESKNSGSGNDINSYEDSAWALSTTAAFPTESDDRKMHGATLMQRPTTPGAFDRDGFPVSGFSPVFTPEQDAIRRLGEPAATYADDSNPSLFEEDLNISDRERRLASVKPQFSKSTDSFPSPAQTQLFGVGDRKLAASAPQRRSFFSSFHGNENDWAPPKRPSHASSSAPSSTRRNSHQSSKAGSAATGANSADINKWEMFGYETTSPMRSSTKESSDGNRVGGHGSVGSNSTLSTRKTAEDPVARKAAEAAGRRSSLEQRYHAQAASSKEDGGPPIGTDPRSQELLIMYLKAMGTDARSAEAIAHTFSTQQMIAEQQGLVGDDDESASRGGTDIPLSQIYAIIADEGKANLANEGASKGSDISPSDRSNSVATASAQSTKAAEASRGSRRRPGEKSTRSSQRDDDLSMGSASTTAERPTQDIWSRAPIRSRSRRRNESSARNRPRSRDPRRNGRGRGRRSRPLWVRTTAPGAVAMTGRAFGAPERPERRQQPATDGDDNNDEAPSAEPEVDSSPHLVEATAVKDNEGLPVVYAETRPLSFGLLLKERSVRRFLMMGLFIIMVVVIIVSVLVIKGPSPTATPPIGPQPQAAPPPSVVPTALPTFISDDILQAAARFSDPDDLTESRSPQRNAVGWMSTRDEFNVTVGSEEWGARYSLAVIYFSTGGDNWSERVDWLDPTKHVCDWSPTIFCKEDEILGRIIQGLDLTNNNLVGQIPPELKNFPYIKYLRFSKNSLMGTLPDALFEMPIVAVIDLETNQLSGTIPGSIGVTSTLSFIDFHANGFTGTIPSELFNVTHMGHVDLSQNKFGGRLSTEFSLLEKLVHLNLSDNIFSGTLADALGTLPKLDALFLDNNRFTGTLPHWLVDRVSREEITLSGNRLTGTVPALSDENLKYILSSHTAVRDTTPTEDIRLKNVDISDNHLSGSIPGWLGLLDSFKSLKIGGNLFSGTFPFDLEINGTSYELWTNLEILNISSNNFDAMALPEAIPKRLNQLDMRNNSYTAYGSLPSTYCDHRSLEFLGLSNNPINLPVSVVLRCVKDMDDLTALVMDGSGLSGELTEVLVNDLQELQMLNFANNKLSGTIPTELFELTTLMSLILSNNTFVGSVPSEIGQTTDLVTFWFDYNVLMSGTIPEEMSALTSLQSLKQTGNTIMRGSVPEGACDHIRNGPAKFIPNEHIECTIDCSCCGPNRTEYCSEGSGRSNPRETPPIRDIFGGGNRVRFLRSPSD